MDIKELKKRVSELNIKDKSLNVQEAIRPVARQRPAQPTKAARKDGQFDPGNLVSALRQQNEEQAARSKAAQPGSPQAAAQLKQAQDEIDQIQAELDGDPLMLITKKMNLQNQRSVLLGRLPSLKSAAWRAGR